MKKALFLDRDGIINIDHGYVYQKENFEFVEGIFDVCQLAMEAGYVVIIITNQSGIARGMYNEEQFNTLMQWVGEQFKTNGTTILDTYFCPHHPKKGQGLYLKDCDCRKPMPGMINQASADHHIDVANSIFIGDKESDMKAAIAAGIEKRILVSSQYQDSTDVACTQVQNVSDITKILPSLLKI